MGKKIKFVRHLNFFNMQIQCKVSNDFEYLENKQIYFSQKFLPFSNKDLMYQLQKI